ncbi:SRPBCC domain-containing protein [Microbacterium sp. zg.B48]|uniref:SRPBCC family protein n=1 Tax=unclassified Microbacterium TaxID=2609290 RepID=UPI00214B7F3F|nr:MULTISPECIES: SRPBCC domain-containing protein [unclassified Microbacterium]MCR2764921.1 SRPBCC domain-containing protein [Microbacterium sp. zg.B48]MCR2808153.1 SRPBCC domain-containing protein [Microbacterium sp. zg.B185]WIM19381.1 SRPBCC domain-containing protein [Microbacterium sp. zg-B185]
MPGSTFDVEVERSFGAPIEHVWRAWTDPADLRMWWGPEGFTCPRAEADIRVGGRIRVTMQAPAAWGGFQQHSTWTITELHPPRLLRYVFTFTDAGGNHITPAEAGIPPGVPDEGQHMVELTPTPDGGTRLRMTESGYTTAEARDLSASGLQQCLDKMAAHVEGMER